VSRVEELNRKVVRLERDRDQLREQVCRLRDKLLEYANECIGCDGKGVVTVVDGEAERVELCGECADLRELLE
jgi:hypothetical protein